MLQVMCRKRMSWWIFAAVKQNMRAFLFFDQSWCNNISCHIQFVHQLFQNISKGPSVRFPGMRLLEMVIQLICGVAFAPSVGVTWCPIRPVSIQAMCQYQCSCLCLWVCLCLSVSEQQVELAFKFRPACHVLSLVHWSWSRHFLASSSPSWGPPCQPLCPDDARSW